MKPGFTQGWFHTRFHTAKMSHNNLAFGAGVVHALGKVLAAHRTLGLRAFGVFGVRLCLKRGRRAIRRLSRAFPYFRIIFHGCIIPQLCRGRSKTFVVIAANKQANVCKAFVYFQE